MIVVDGGEEGAPVGVLHDNRLAELRWENGRGSSGMYGDAQELARVSPERVTGVGWYGSRRWGRRGGGGSDVWWSFSYLERGNQSRTLGNRR